MELLDNAQQPYSVQQWSKGPTLSAHPGHLCSTFVPSSVSRAIYLNLHTGILYPVLPTIEKSLPIPKQLMVIKTIMLRMCLKRLPADNDPSYLRSISSGTGPQPRHQAGSVSMNPVTHLKLSVNQPFKMSAGVKGCNSIKIIFHNLPKPVASVWIAIQAHPQPLGRTAVRFQPPISPRRSFLNPAHRYVPEGDEKCHAPQCCNLPRLKHLTRIDLSARTLGVDQSLEPSFLNVARAPSPGCGLESRPLPAVQFPAEAGWLAQG